MPEPGRVVGTIGAQIGDVVVRYPKADDVQLLLDFINPASAEQTFIMFQGVQLTFEEERQWLDGRLASIASGDTVLLVLDTGERIVGTAAVDRKRLAERHVGIFGITLSSDYRGMGLGRKLMRATMREAETQIEGLRIVTLGVFANNERARKLYEQEGFVEYGRFPNGVRHRDAYVDHIFMYRMLDHSGGSQE